MKISHANDVRSIVAFSLLRNGLFLENAAVFDFFSDNVRHAKPNVLLKFQFNMRTRHLFNTIPKYFLFQSMHCGSMVMSAFATPQLSLIHFAKQVVENLQY